MERIAVFPGSFDPITKGHESIIRRALPLFDKIIIAIGVNSSKSTMFTLQQREEWISSIFAGEKKIEVKSYEGLTIDFCKKEKAHFILRGLRTQADFEYEKAISQMNLALAKDIETVFLITDPVYSAISSTIVRDILRNKGDVSSFIPEKMNIA
ncbi:MAG: pantetheine-phosphate adenylyltransferase [Flavobacteriales bacterium]|nr:pantetheine-phosphate adenylyltransferase [Flavobacteriales bacterium]